MKRGDTLVTLILAFGAGLIADVHGYFEYMKWLAKYSDVPEIYLTQIAKFQALNYEVWFIAGTLTCILTGVVLFVMVLMKD